jgi:hypothetical protein
VRTASLFRYPDVCLPFGQIVLELAMVGDTSSPHSPQSVTRRAGVRGPTIFQRCRNRGLSLVVAMDFVIFPISRVTGLNAGAE